VLLDSIPVVYMLHRVLPHKQMNNYYFQRKTAISWSRFIELLDGIEERGQKTVTISSIANGSEGKSTVAISFDDGYLDNVLALNEICRRGMTATLFPVQSFVQQGFSVIDDMAGHLMHIDSIETELYHDLLRGRLKKILRRLTPKRYRYFRRLWFGIDYDANSSAKFMSESQLSDFIFRGIEVGVHGVSHRVFSCLSDRRLLAELTDARSWLFSLGAKGVLPICFPHGDYDQRVVEMCLHFGVPLLGVDVKSKNSNVWRRQWITE